MNAVGIICEYNPFHLGHARMLKGLRRQYDAPLVCAMSGNFVQRGDAAVAHKHARGEMAVRCGADLVLELPTPWAMASAERFAAGGVALLASTGVVSHLAFGSECGDLTALQAAEAALSQPELMPRIRQLLAQGMAYAPARQQAAEELGMDPWLCRKLGAEVTVPQAQEMLRYARNKRRTLKMRVECEGYAPHECRAYCRMDAVMDAANAWGADYMQIKDKARVGVSARLPE